MDTLEGYISNFYLLEDMYSVEKPKNPILSRRFIGWNQEIAKYREYFAKKVARTLRDSLAGMTLSELRWWNSKSFIDMDIEGFKWTNDNDRSKVFNEIEASFYSIYDVLALRDIFWYGNWFTSEFGGRSWARIIDKIRSYTKTSPVLYCDYTFDTVHNGGIAFNKKFLVNTLFESHASKDLLNCKLGSHIYNSPYFPIQMDSNVLNLFVYGYENNIYKVNKSIFDGIRNNIYRTDNFSFPTIKWNRKRNIKYKIKSFDRKEESVDDNTSEHTFHVNLSDNTIVKNKKKKSKKAPNTSEMKGEEDNEQNEKEFWLSDSNER